MTTAIIIFSIGVIVGLVAWGVLYGGKKGKVGVVGDQEKREQKILELLSRKGKIKNGDVQKLLGVADSTATKYLQQLENEGKIRQQGKAGRFVYYVKK